MARRKRPERATTSQPVWRKVGLGLAIGLIVVVILIGFGRLIFDRNEQPIAGPTSTDVPTLPPAHTPTSPPTATSTTSPVTPTSLAPPAAATLAPASGTATATNGNTTEPPLYSYKIINIYPHDPMAFTQGLVFEEGIFYEGTGLRGQSSLRKVEVETGTVIQSLQLPAQFFGEGITIFGDNLYQLTWQSQVGFVYDKDSFELRQEFNYPTEGWGLTHDGEKLIMSDGTATLYFRDPETLEEIGRVEVRDRGEPVRLLNELEYINGEVYANVWRTDRIARIAPESGDVLGWINLEGLLEPEDRSQQVDVLNGIAYDATGDRLFVTGKWWPKLFEIELVPAN